jgi:hypothetical protein
MIKEDRLKCNIQCTQIFTTYVEKINVFSRTSSGSLGSVLDSHAGGPVSIPDVGDSVMKVVVAGLYRAVECGRNAVRKEEATRCITAVRKT